MKTCRVPALFRGLVTRVCVLSHSRVIVKPVIVKPIRRSFGADVRAAGFSVALAVFALFFVASCNSSDGEKVTSTIPADGETEQTRNRIGE